MAATDNANQSLVVTAFWEVNPGEEAAVAGLLKEFLPQAQREPGVKEFQIHQNLAEPRKYFFYEVFAGEAAFADHQQTRTSRTSSSARRFQSLRNANARSSASSDVRAGYGAPLAGFSRAPSQQFLFASVAGEACRHLERGARFRRSARAFAGDRRERSGSR